MKDPFSYITTEENNYNTEFVPLTNSKEWNMKEHIERCLNVSNGWYHQGKNDGIRPYDDIVTPIIDVAFRSEGFDVKDIVPYVEDVNQAYKSFFVKKFHPQWARKNLLDTFIDEVVESSIIFDLVLIKDINETKPEVVKLQDIAFCDQTDVMAGAICIKHNYNVPDLLDYKGVWINDKIDEAIVMAQAEKEVSTAGDRKIKTPNKYIEVYELHGTFPETWLDKSGDNTKYTNQLHIITYYTASDGSKNGICLFKGPSKPLKKIFKSLKIDMVRSHGRACGRSIVERLFEPQVWKNYSVQKIKKMLDGVVNLLQTDSEEFGNKKISELKENTVIKHEPGRPLTRVNMDVQNLVPLQNFGVQQENQARTLGSASEAALGKNPVSGTPFALQELIVQQGEGIHEYRKGKIATFFADVLYPEIIIPSMVRDMKGGLKFSEELSLDELQEVATQISDNLGNTRIKEGILQGKTYTEEEKVTLKSLIKDNFTKGGTRRFMELLKDEMDSLPVKVFVNVAGKQKYLAQNAQALTNIIREIMRNPQVFQQIPGLAKTFNQLLESSGLNPIDFTQITTAPVASPAGGETPQETPAELPTLTQ
jgi:hypothetical protein